MTPTTSPQIVADSFWSGLRRQVRARREARAAHRRLVNELSSYTTKSDIEDLLLSIRHEDGPEAQRIRDILTGTRLSLI